MGLLIDPLITFDLIDQDELNWCLRRWAHKMGPLNRPTPSKAYGLRHAGRLVAVTATDHLMATACAGLTREQAVELSRVCAERADLCRVVLRLWREFVFPGFREARGVAWAISYQDAAQHSGNLYRFDGWVRLGFSHSGTDTRSGRPGRDKIIWGWCADPLVRAERAEQPRANRAPPSTPAAAVLAGAAGLTPLSAPDHEQIQSSPETTR